jgi:hypothetical protein
LPGVPAPFLPMAGAYTGALRAEASLKPTFAWRAPEEEGSCAALTYEIELSRECVPGELQDCAFEDPELRESGLEAAEWTPSEPLPVSRVVPVGSLYAWRVRACEKPERCSNWSRVSYVNVGRLIDDIDADGYSDRVEVGSDGEVSAMLFSGDDATPLAASTAKEGGIGAPTHGRLLGDVNGDEFPDMVVWSADSTTEPPRVILGATTPSGWTSEAMSAPLESYHRGGRAGDLDADGFADVAISEFELVGSGARKGITRLYRGHSAFSLAGPINVTPPDTVSPAQFGVALEGGFDSNADGYADLFILDNSDGTLFLVRGAGSLSSAIDASVQSPYLAAATLPLASELLFVGDRDGDGYGDLAASTTGEDGLAIHVFSGGPLLPQAPVVNVSVGSAYVSLEWVGGGVDLGSDGRDDFVVHALESVDAASRLRVLPGSTEAQTAEAFLDFANFGTTQFFRSSLAGGDYDGDGVFDLTVRGAGSQITLLRGGKPASKIANCAQFEDSFPLIGDWCSVENSTFSGPDYVGAAVR